MKIGIVIGSYGMPQAVDLNIAAIRHFNADADIPVLVCDDHSDPDGELRAVCKRWNADLYVHPRRVGHVNGDLNAFFHGLLWAKEGGLDVLFKLSQRLIIQQPDWATLWANRLMSSPSHLLCRGQRRKGCWIRTEAVGLKVASWSQPDIIHRFAPAGRRRAAERFLYGVYRDHFAGQHDCWGLLAKSAYERRDQIMFWKTNTPQQYAALAERLGVSAIDIDGRGSRQIGNYRR